MIDFRELRFGNIVQDGSKIKSTSSVYVYFPANKEIHAYIRMDSDQGVNSDDLLPVVINGNILSNCGFKACAVNSFYLWISVIKNEISLYFNTNTQALQLRVYKMEQDGEYSYTYTNLRNIKHLHQLQNFYFALSGEELEIDVENI